MKTVVIHQPDFLPYLGFFQRLLYADVFVILDTVQFERKHEAWTRRDKIKTDKGEKWLSLNIQKAPYDVAICDILLSRAVDWRKSNLNLLRANYGKALFFKEIFSRIEELYAFKCERMMDFNMKSIEMLLDFFDIKVQMIFASDLDPQGKKNDLVVDIVKKVGANRYLSGIGARDYFDPTPYNEAGIEVIWQNFVHPVYPQLYEGFLPYLTSVDLLFNCGINKSREILRSC